MNITRHSSFNCRVIDETFYFNLLKCLHFKKFVWRIAKMVKASKQSTNWLNWIELYRNDLRVLTTIQLNYENSMHKFRPSEVNQCRWILKFCIKLVRKMCVTSVQWKYKRLIRMSSYKKNQILHFALTPTIGWFASYKIFLIDYCTVGCNLNTMNEFAYAEKKNPLTSISMSLNKWISTKKKKSLFFFSSKERACTDLKSKEIIREIEYFNRLDAVKIVFHLILCVCSFRLSLPVQKP